MATTNHYKKCAHCAEILHISNFHKNKSTTDGYSYHCRTCTKTWHQKLNEEKPFRRVWRGMMERCVWGGNYSGDENWQATWNNYGGRGIQVSEELQDFEIFEQLAEELEEDFIKQYGPNVERFLDRIDPNGHYERGNLRFLSQFESSMNRRSTADPICKHLGINLPLYWWAKIYEKEPSTLIRRIQSGMPLARALNEPVQDKFSHTKVKQVIETDDQVEHIDGVYYLNRLPITESDLCRHFNIANGTFRARYKKKNWDLMRSLTTCT